MRIAIIGAAGQLGSDLVRLLPDALQFTHAQIEVTDPASVNAALSQAAPELVINTAAYNLVDKAEDERDRAFAINAEGAGNLAAWCAARDATLVHVSTDYVFGLDDRRTTPYREEDAAGPLGVYGLSKLRGEELVRAACARHFVIRTCGLYGRAATKAKGNFVQTMLRLAGERDELRVVHDQRCTPSYTADVAAMIVALLRTQEYGLYHVTNAGSMTWYELACEIFRLKGLPTRVFPIPSSEYPTKARRPSYSVLDCARAEAAAGFRMPAWQEALGRYLQAAT
jgi:dTDP-4-dehydrorhamnose reductase